MARLLIVCVLFLCIGSAVVVALAADSANERAIAAAEHAGAPTVLFITS